MNRFSLSWRTMSCLLTFAVSGGFAQGVFPPKPDTPIEVKPAASLPLLIGETVPQRLTVVDAQGQVRSLLSYKAATDLLVIGFYSPRCSYDQALERDLRKLYNAYKDWHATFLGVSVNSDETLSELADAMTQAGVPYPAVRDEHQKVAKALHVTATPEIVIIDEWNQLRYRGPLHSAVESSKKSRVDYAGRTIESIVGAEQVPHPEPGDLIGCPLRP